MKKYLGIILALVVLTTSVLSASATPVSPYTIFGDDDRWVVTDTTVSPYSSVCNLTITYANGKIGYGTGFMVSKNNMATAAHCLYDHTKGGWVKSIAIVPGDNTADKPFGTITAIPSNSDFVVPSDWTQNANTASDYGVVVLDKAVSSNIGSLNMYVPSDSYLDGLEVSLSGYDYKTRKQYLATGLITGYDSYRIKFRLDTLSGMSGSPVYDSDNEVIGIYNYAVSGVGDGTLDDDAPASQYNRCQRITSSIKTFLLRSKGVRSADVSINT